MFLILMIWVCFEMKFKMKNQTVLAVHFFKSAFVLISIDTILSD